jgi:hypothetical protein
MAANDSKPLRAGGPKGNSPNRQVRERGEIGFRRSEGPAPLRFPRRRFGPSDLSTIGAELPAILRSRLLPFGPTGPATRDVWITIPQKAKPGWAGCHRRSNKVGTLDQRSRFLPKYIVLDRPFPAICCEIRLLLQVALSERVTPEGRTAWQCGVPSPTRISPWANTLTWRRR